MQIQKPPIHVYHDHFSASDFHFWIFGEQSQNDLVAFIMGWRPVVTTPLN
jgi:hypothetical protein